jgi:hypothetical protein
MFKGRKLLIATRHGKERVISPILERELGVMCIVPQGFDTDKFGTFSGEVKRLETAIVTARQKCLEAMSEFGVDLAVSSEGSFGSHPFIPFAQANEEVILLKDLRNDLEIIARTITTETNFAVGKVSNEAQLESFLNKVGFPQHGVILKPGTQARTWKKCSGDLGSIKLKLNKMLQSTAEVQIETDMRAMRNPTRMKTIEAATEKLVEKIKSICPQCGTPGFSVTEFQEGLPCKLCYQPTRSSLWNKSVCKRCAYELISMYPLGRKTEDPMYCDACNP